MLHWFPFQAGIPAQSKANRNRRSNKTGTSARAKTDNRPFPAEFAIARVYNRNSFFMRVNSFSEIK